MPALFCIHRLSSLIDRTCVGKKVNVYVLSFYLVPVPCQYKYICSHDIYVVLGAVSKRDDFKVCVKTDLGCKALEHSQVLAALGWGVGRGNPRTHSTKGQLCESL